MIPFLNNMIRVKTYWEQLNGRDRMMLGVGGVCCVCYFVYSAVYSPLVSAVNQARLHLADDRSTLVWMQNVHQQYVKTQATQALSKGQLLTVLGDQLKRTSFHRYPYQLEQTGSGDIQLMFNEVPYQAFVAWLKRFSEHYTCSIQQLSVDHTTTSGVVRAMVVLDYKSL